MSKADPKAEKERANQCLVALYAVLPLTPLATVLSTEWARASRQHEEKENEQDMERAEKAKAAKSTSEKTCLRKTGFTAQKKTCGTSGLKKVMTVTYNW